MAKSFGSRVAPKSVAGAGIESLPNIAPKPYFELYVHPKQWSFIEAEPGKFEWLPDLTKVTYKAGVNACIYELITLANGTKRKVVKNLDEVRLLTTRRGYQLVDREGPAGEYLMVLDTQKGEHYHATWETFEGNGSDAQPVNDPDVKVAFMRKLVASGAVTKPPEVFRKRAIRAAADAVQRWAAAPKSIAQVAGQAKAEARLQAMEGTALPVPGETPKPKRQRAPKKPAPSTDTDTDKDAATA